MRIKNNAMTSLVMQGLTPVPPAVDMAAMATLAGLADLMIFLVHFSAAGLAEASRDAIPTLRKKAEICVIMWTSLLNRPALGVKLNLT